MLTASVSNIELYRNWRGDEELGVDWILNRILHPEQTPAMLAGEALHKGIETFTATEAERLTVGPYRFDFACDVDLAVATLRELRISKFYGDLQVRGRVDDISGQRVTDYKTTGYFDPDRYMNGYQWRFYLDMLEADRFRWIVLVMAEGDDPMHYIIREVHQLEQRRYPDLRNDCEQMAADYFRFAEEHLIPAIHGGWLPLSKGA